MMLKFLKNACDISEHHLAQFYVCWFKSYLHTECYFMDCLLLFLLTTAAKCW